MIFETTSVTLVVPPSGIRRPVLLVKERGANAAPLAKDTGMAKVLCVAVATARLKSTFWPQRKLGAVRSWKAMLLVRRPKAGMSG